MKLGFELHFLAVTISIFRVDYLIILYEHWSTRAALGLGNLDDGSIKKSVFPHSLFWRNSRVQSTTDLIMYWDMYAYLTIASASLEYAL